MGIQEGIGISAATTKSPRLQRIPQPLGKAVCVFLDLTRDRNGGVALYMASFEEY